MKKHGGLDYTPQAFPGARAPDGPAPDLADRLARLGLIRSDVALAVGDLVVITNHYESSLNGTLGQVGKLTGKWMLDSDKEQFVYIDQFRLHRAHQTPLPIKRALFSLKHLTKLTLLSDAQIQLVAHFRSLGASGYFLGVANQQRLELAARIAVNLLFRKLGDSLKTVSQARLARFRQKYEATLVSSMSAAISTEETNTGNDPYVTICLAQAVTTQVLVKHGRIDLGERNTYADVQVPCALTWLQSGSTADIAAAEKYASANGYRVFTYPTTEQNPLDRARADVMKMG